MNEQIKAIYHQAPARDDGYSTDPPFNDWIMQEPLPSNFKMPQMESYHGITNPMAHLESFTSLMPIHEQPMPPFAEPSHQL